AMVLKFVLLNTLNISMRSCSFLLLPSLPRPMFLNSEKSTRLVGGPLMAPREPLPGTFGTKAGIGFGVDWKHAVLNHWRKVCGALALGSQRKFGRATVSGGAMIPKPAGSQFDVDGENGRPLCSVTIPEISQPPNALFTQSLRFAKSGMS